MEQQPLISIVLPVFNEEETLNETILQIQHYINSQPATFEVIYVDDGSNDDSVELIRAAIQQYTTIRLVQFSRNFGHQIAISAGIRYASGDAVVVMDADLQDPPEVITQMIEKWREGYDVVYGKRRSRQGESYFKKISAQIFYRLLSKMTDTEIPLDTGDFRLIDKKVITQLKRMNETQPFVRGMVSWVGFKQTAVMYERHERFAGESKYPLRKMLSLAFDGITSFSVVPLKLANYFGGLLLAIDFLYLVIHLLIGNMATDNWIIVNLLGIGGGLSIAVGMVGIYLERIVSQSKDRPLYIVDELIGFPYQSKITKKNLVKNAHGIRQSANG